MKIHAFREDNNSGGSRPYNTEIVYMHFGVIYKVQKVLYNESLYSLSRLSWLFKTSTAIYPSGYISLKTVNPRAYVYGQVHEALRMRDYIGEPYTPVFFYTAYIKDDSVYYSKV